MSEGVLSDSRIAAMSPAQRRELIQRLERPLDELVPASMANRVRRTRLTLMVAGATGLIPWIVYLGFTLPESYVAHNWPATWVGFDSLLVAFMAVTAVLGWLRRQLVLLTAFTTGVLLICDAWFDVLTAGPGEMWESASTALLAELPLAVIMITSALRIVRLTAIRLWLLDPGTSLWRLPLLP
ncbi:MAG: hypothetical protein JO044_05230 [Mycobacteriaceae bacterium]|nr:hypothetical protein [Mycobacteriaceae bacterium]MBV9640011.1 hypothetical protein [Mycobacteriaceae bacterium]